MRTSFIAGLLLSAIVLAAANGVFASGLKCDNNNNDWRCKGCRDASDKFPNLKDDCYICVEKAAPGGAQATACHQCMTASKDSNVVKECLNCVQSGVPGWACVQHCASCAKNEAQMQICVDCLAARNKAGLDLWGCKNCLKKAHGDVNKLRMCAKCVDPQDSGHELDVVRCGKCLNKKNNQARQHCYDCLYSHPNAQYKCVP